MQAIRFYGNQQAVLEELPLVQPIPGKARIKVSYAGICGSDIAIYKGLNKRAVYPVTPGHEFVGIIDALPADYIGPLSIGCRVMVIPTVSCKTCWGCKHGLRHICDTIKFLGIQFDGGFAEYALAEIENLRLLPDTLDFELGVLSEPVAVGIHAVSFLFQPKGKKVLVFGSGPIGLITALIARMKGAEVTIAEPMETRRNAAKRFGFSTIDPSKDDGLDIKQRITSDIGFDAFFECAGHPSTFDFMIQTAKQRSQIIIVATYKEAPIIDVFMLSRKEISINITWTYLDTDCEKAIKLLNDEPGLFKPLVTHIFDIKDTDAAMKAFIAGGDTLKVSIKVD